MALFNHLFPYSNLHDINLDWIISIIKSIDPAVIQALQELTPDIIEQVNQKVAEAQAAAIAAQSSASEANTARENAATSAAKAAQDATEAATNATSAETAKTAVENSLVPVISTATAAAGLTVDINRIARTGKTAMCSFQGSLTIEPGSEWFTKIFTLPEDFMTKNNEQFFALALIGDAMKSVRIYGREVAVESSVISTHPAFKALNIVFPIN